MVTTDETSLEGLLESWKLEKKTNQYGLAHLADRAIKLIECEFKNNYGRHKRLQKLYTSEFHERRSKRVMLFRT